jgi:hypothetical protein
MMVLAVALGVSMLGVSCGKQESEDELFGLSLSGTAFGAEQGEGMGMGHGKGMGQGRGMGAGKGMGKGMDSEHHAKVVAALESGDYAAWKAAMTEGGRTPRVLDYITAENFARFAEAHRLEQAGKHDEAVAIRKELGLPNAEKGGMGQGRHSRGGCQK